MLIYLHVPKTGGTSMLEILSQIYGDYDKEFLKENIWWTGQEYVNQLSNSRFYPGAMLGHFSYGVHELINEDCHYMTMLRNPIDRVVSLFYYKKNLIGGPRETWRAMGFSEQTTLYDYVTSGRDLAVFNAQTSQLAGIPLDTNFRPVRVPDRNDFQLVRQHIETMTVGLLEHFEISVEHFIKRLNWQTEPQLVHENNRPHPRPQAEDPKAIRAILDHNQFDLLLYDIARGKLLTRL